MENKAALSARARPRSVYEPRPIRRHFYITDYQSNFDANPVRRIMALYHNYESRSRPKSGVVGGKHSSKPSNWIYGFALSSFIAGDMTLLKLLGGASFARWAALALRRARGGLDVM
ncbi:hypothetical protein EVAR_63979_1 [Eumeta japonica]|uniref:Uncharacterized protein n=1 Tax=Eumeta variegata TaxID=151549 RepID=A0A4C1ZGD3_EUMVA|nr:hypothetical protein EVAR_63979_1 [Eumeta japonica]